MNAPPDTIVPAASLSPIETDAALARRAGTVAVTPWTDAPVRLAMVPVAELLIDRNYQRHVSAGGGAKIRRMLRDFSWPRFGALTVAEADGGFAIVDGQHRAILAHHLGLTEVPALVVAATGRTDQARDFLEINITRTSLPSVDRFRAAVAAGNPEAVELAAMLRDLRIGFDLAPGQRMGPRQTRSVARLQAMVREYGQGTVYTALEMLTEAQPDQAELLTSFAIRVVVAVVDRILTAGGDIDRLAAKLPMVDFDGLSADARALQKQIGGSQHGYGITLLARDFNKGLKSGRIPE